MADALIPPKAVEGLMTKAFLEGTVAAGLFWDALLKCRSKASSLASATRPQRSR